MNGLEIVDLYEHTNDEKNKKFNMCMSFTFFVVVGVVVLNYIAKYLK